MTLIKKKITEVESIVNKADNRKTAGKIYLPKGWIGKKVKTVLLSSLVVLVLVTLMTSQTAAIAKKDQQPKQAVGNPSAGNDQPTSSPPPTDDGKNAPTDNGKNAPTINERIDIFIHGKKHHDSHSNSDSEKYNGLTQIPSVTTDFPDNDKNAIEVHATSANKDSIGSYHVRGEIKNLSNDTTLQFVKVTAHLNDESGHPVAVTTCCYADPSDIEPGHTSTFDSFAQKDEISGTPNSYRLSFDWR
jgi:hypothetical protein